MEIQKMQSGSTTEFQILIEKTKIYDKLFLDHGIKIHWLNEAVIEHKLAEDDEIVEWRQAMIMEDKIKQEQMNSNNVLTDWFMENAKKEVEALGTHDSYGKNTRIDFDHYWDMFDILEYYVNCESACIRQEVKAERRKILASGDEKSYAQFLAT
jgi:hypothetical protein